MTHPSFRNTGLSPDLFSPLFAKSDVELHQLGAQRVFADPTHMMIDAEVCEGAEAASIFERFLTNPNTSYLHVHNARHGCCAARVELAY